MLNDLKFAFRQLLKNPGFTTVVVLTLALGIGANTAIFGVINAVMFQSLPFSQPERLVWIEEVSKGNSREPWGAHFLEWRDHSQTLERVAAYDGSTQTLTGSGEPDRVQVGNASADFMPLLGVRPTAPGRSFSPDEDQPGGSRVAILSHGLWQRRYSGAKDIVGQSITLNDTSFTVIGVLPADFHFFQQSDVWIPLALDREKELTGDTHYYGSTIARLKPGVSRDTAGAELDTLLQRYEATRPDGKPRFADFRTHIVPLRDHLLGDTRRPLLVLVGAVGLVLLIACANVANLLLARAVTRQKEKAIRAALGAGRLRLIRQALTECLLLALTGGGLGLLLAIWLTNLLGAFGLTDALGEMAHVSAITIDLRVFGFALLVSLLTGTFFGLLPMVRLSRQDLNETLRDGGRGSRSHGRGLRGTLMVSEVALAIVLLAGAGLLIRSFVKLIEVNPGYRSEDLLTAQLRLPPRYDGDARRAQFYDQLLQRMAALPGVESVGATSQLPLTRYNMGGTLRVEDAAEASGKREIGAPITAVSAPYFRTMGIALRAGRLFDDADTQGAPSVAVLSETLAQKLFPNEDPVGKQLFVAGSGSELTTVVGVVSDIRHQGLDQQIEQAAYLSYRQLPRPMMSLVLRTKATPSSLASPLRAAVREIDPALPIFDVMTMGARLSHSVAGRRFNLLLLGAFAALALVLAGVGVYGVIAYVVTERTQEVGIRMALGAGRGEIVALVLRHGMMLAGLGVLLGLVAAVGFTRVLTNLLFEIKPGDPVTFVGVSLVLLVVALLASWLPARRAARVDPMVALRTE